MKRVCARDMGKGGSARLNPVGRGRRGTVWCAERCSQGL